MKYTFADDVLFGIASAEEPVWSLRSVQDHRTDAQLQEDFGNHATSQANARPPMRSHLAIREDDDDDSDSDSDEQDVLAIKVLPALIVSPGMRRVPLFESAQTPCHLIIWVGIKVDFFGSK